MRRTKSGGGGGGGGEGGEELSLQIILQRKKGQVGEYSWLNTAVRSSYPVHFSLPDRIYTLEGQVDSLKVHPSLATAYPGYRMERRV